MEEKTSIDATFNENDVQLGLEFEQHFTRHAPPFAAFRRLSPPFAAFRRLSPRFGCPQPAVIAVGQRLLLVLANLAYQNPPCQLQLLVRARHTVFPCAPAAILSQADALACGAAGGRQPGRVLPAAAGSARAAPERGWAAGSGGGGTTSSTPTLAV